MLNTVLQQTYFHNRVLDYLIFAGVLFIGIILVKVIKKILTKNLIAWAQSTPSAFDDFLVSVFQDKAMPFLFYGLLYLAFQFLHVAPVITKVLNLLGIILVTYYGVRVSLALLKYFLEHYWMRKTKNAGKRHVINGVFTFAKIMVWGFACILLLDNLGVKISALVTGLGIGGVAVALAAQTILGDLFNYFTIYFDRPFEVGDYIVIGEYMGTVEHIGLKTTRLRSLGGEQLVLSNTDLTNSRVRNYKRMERRRVSFQIRVTHQTGVDHLRIIPGLLSEIIKSMEGVTFDRAHFAAFADFSLVFEVVYYVNSSDYSRYMDLQQEINLKIKEEFTKLGVDFAYPTQSLYIKQEPDGDSNH